MRFSREDYTGNEIIEFHPNEHFIDQQDAADKERITDTNFIIYGKKKKKYHLECESSLPDGRMTIRLFEYDAQNIDSDISQYSSPISKEL